MNVKSRLQSGYLVSTVSLPDGRYETMVFPQRNGRTEYLDVHCALTRDRTQAKLNHADAVLAYSDHKPFTTEGEA